MKYEHSLTRLMGNDPMLVNCDFSGMWTLKTNGPSSDDYYKSEGHNWLKRKAILGASTTLKIHHNGNKMTMQRIVKMPMQKIIDNKNDIVIGSNEVTEFEDVDGVFCVLSKWNDDKTKILRDIHRKDDTKRT